MNRLFTLTDQVHFYAAMDFVVWRAMTECRQIEIGAEFAIRASENSKVKLRGDPFSIIVSRLQNPLRLFAINADQQTSVPAAQESNFPQEGDSCERFKVANRGARKEGYCPSRLLLRIRNFSRAARNQPLKD